MDSTYNLTEPIDMIKFSINEVIYIKCRGDRELKGKLIAFDDHFNMILTDAEEIYKEEETD